MKPKTGHRSWQIIKALNREAPPERLKLLPRERRILRLRESGRTLREIGEMHGLSAERIRQIEWLARKKLARRR